MSVGRLGMKSLEKHQFENKYQKVQESKVPKKVQYTKKSSAITGRPYRKWM